MGIVTVGVDIGQKRDPTAIAVVELDQRTPTDDHHLARHLERLPLMTSYPDVAKRILEVARGVRERTRVAPHLYLDATGVGTPVVDVLRDAGYPGGITACYFTHGDRRTQEGSQVSIGKAWLVSRLQVLLQSQRLHLPITAEAQALARELQDYEIKIDQHANDTYGAFKVGTHDDLVTALGLAIQPKRPSARLVTW